MHRGHVGLLDATRVGTVTPSLEATSTDSQDSIDRVGSEAIPQRRSTPGECRACGTRKAVARPSVHTWLQRTKNLVTSRRRDESRSTRRPTLRGPGPVPPTSTRCGFMGRMRTAKFLSYEDVDWVHRGKGSRVAGDLPLEFRGHGIWESCLLAITCA